MSELSAYLIYHCHFHNLPHLCLVSFFLYHLSFFFFFNDPATTEIYTLSLHDALPIRPHRLAVGLYNGDELVRTDRIELDVTGERTSVKELVGVPAPALLLANDDDLTYCKLRLDEHSLRTLRDGGIARLPESLPRALCWSAAWDMTRDGELATRDYLTLVLAGAEADPNIGLLQSLNRQALRALEIYADPAWAPSGYRAMAEKAFAAL